MKLIKKQLENIEEDHNYLSNKKEFIELYNKAISGGKHNTLIINYTNDKDKMYLDTNFKVL